MRLENGAPSPLRVMPLTLDVLMDAAWETCPGVTADDAWWRYQIASDDVCYVVRDVSNSAAARDATLSTWGSQVKNLFIMSDAATDPALKIVHVDAFASKAAGRRTLVAMTAANQIDAVRGCKFVVTTNTGAWTNPRIVLATIQGVSPAWPVALGYYWMDMGFVDSVTVPAAGNTIWSASAWAKLVESIASGACVPDTMKNDDILLGACALAAGVVPVNLNNVDSSGAMVQNGVPLEPGPPGEQMSWLQQPHTRAGHWASIEGANPGLLTSLWASFKAVYGPWGRLVGDAPSASPIPLAQPPTFKSFASAAPCAVRATRTLRATLDANRASLTTAMPLSIDVAAEITSAECNPRTAPASADPPGTAGVPHVIDHSVCTAITYSGVQKLIKFVARGGWGWRMRHKEGDFHRRLWIFAQTAVPELYVYSLPGLDAGDAAGSWLRIVQYLASLDPVSVAHCKWWYIGGSDVDWVNARALANTVRALHPDTPIAAGLWLHGGRDVDVPATGRALLSRAALAALGSDVLVAACPRAGGGFDNELGRCAAQAGVIPVHTYALDVAGMAVGMDWAFQQEMYLMGWGMTVNMGLTFSPQPTDGYPWRMALLEAFYAHLFGDLWNVTTPEFFSAGELGDHPVHDGGVGDLADGGVVERDGDGWRRTVALDANIAAEKLRVAIAAGAWGSERVQSA